MTQTTNARLAGIMYLSLIITGILSIMIIPSELIDWENAAATLENIRTRTWLYQLGLLLSVLCYLSYLFLAMALFRLFKDTDQQKAWIMLILVSLSVPISLSGVAAKVDVLSLLKSFDYLSVMSEEMLAAQVMLKLESFGNSLIVAQVFWGLWLFPLGQLVIKSDFTPKFIGYFLIIGCFYYLIESIAQTAFPEYREHIIHQIMSFGAVIGEFGLCFWLLVFADKKKFIS